MEKQLELNNIPRKRVALVTEDKPQSDAQLATQLAEDAEQLTIGPMVPSCPPTQAVAEIWLGYTPWTSLEDNPPTEAGFYDFRDAPGTEPMIGRDVVMRGFFDPAINRIPVPTRQWRGLSQPWPESFNPCLRTTPYLKKAPLAPIATRRRLLND